MSRARAVLAVAGLVLLAAAPGAAVKRRAFATSVTGSGDLSSWPDAGGLTGVAAGDQICRTRAALAGLPNADTYRAWLSTSTADAFCHVQGLTGTKAGSCGGGTLPLGGPWYNRNGISPYTGRLDLLTGPAGEIYRSVVTDEYGNSFPSLSASYLWSGTGPTGGVTGSSTCGNWTQAAAGTFGSYGSALGSLARWTFLGGTNCSSARRLLCLEPGESEAAPPRWALPGALAFVTSAAGTGDLGSWPQAGGETGLAAGDAICRNLAAAAHLPAPESFVAWLSDGSSAAADRVVVDAVFRRIDGTAVANSRADLLDGTTRTSIHQRETGVYGTDSYGFTWTGTLPDGSVAAADCDGWTSGTDAFTGQVGAQGLERVAEWTSIGQPQACDGLRYLFCFANTVTVFWDGFEYTGDASRWSSSTP